MLLKIAKDSPQQKYDAAMLFSLPQVRLGLRDGVAEPVMCAHALAVNHRCCHNVHATIPSGNYF